MISLKIYLQQSPIVVKIFPTKINVHTKQAKLVNALRYKYEGIRPNSHVIHIKSSDQTFWRFFFFSIFMVFEFLNTLKNRTSKVRSIKTSTKHSLKKKQLWVLIYIHMYISVYMCWVQLVKVIIQWTPGIMWQSSYRWKRAMLGRHRCEEQMGHFDVFGRPTFLIRLKFFHGVHVLTFCLHKKIWQVEG